MGATLDYVIAKRMPPNRRRAEGLEDAKQDALLALRDRLVSDLALLTPSDKRFRTGNDIKKWMCRTSSNKAADALRRNRHEVGASDVPAVAPEVEPNAALSDMASATRLSDQTTHSPDELAELGRLVSDRGTRFDNAIGDELSAWVDPDRRVVTSYLAFATYLEMQHEVGLGSSSVQRIIHDFLRRPGIRDANASTREALMALVTTSFDDAVLAVESLPARILRPLIDFRGD